MPTSRDVLTVTLPLALPDAESVVRSALQAEQFGVITEVDFQLRFREKLGIDSPPHKTLGACNPRLAAEVIAANATAALALPCNIVLREEDGSTVVAALRPTAALGRFGPSVASLAAQAEESLVRVFSHIHDTFSPDHAIRPRAGA
jgi:uncharacterized protein (DUF302 family)